MIAEKISKIICLAIELYYGSFDYDEAYREHLTVKFIDHKKFYRKTLEECIYEAIDSYEETRDLYFFIDNLISDDIFKIFKWSSERLRRKNPIKQIPHIWLWEE